MKHLRGKPLEPGEKRAIVNLKKYFDHHKQQFGLIESTVELTADALQIGVSTVKRVMADYQREPSLLDKPPAPRGHPQYAIDGSNEEAVRYFIRQANQHGKSITLNDIQDLICQRNTHAQFHLSTLARTLDRWGFEFGKGKRSQHLKEKDEIIVLRQNYLRRMRANRNSDGLTIKPEIYLDESYVNKNYSNDFIWYSEEDGS